MNADHLLTLYDHVTEAPDAIARLRRLVLDLAVRGRLVHQDATDEPASELLRRIAAEKARLVEVGEIKPRKLKSRSRQNLVEYIKPSGWELTDLGSLALKITDGAHKTPTYVQEGVPFVSVKDFSAGRLDLSDTRFIPPTEHDVLYKRCDPRRGDILFGRIGTLGKAVLVDTDVEFSLFVSVGLIRFDSTNINCFFFLTVLNSPFVKAEFDRIKIGGATHTNKLNLGDLHTVAIPLPPLAEQQRIVSKVDELMALCDRLEEAQAVREDARDRLTTASLARLSGQDTDDRAFRSHARFAVDALPALTARADQVTHLRQTILDLAMRGKLVEQNPGDEPASELLKRIEAEKARLVKAGEIRKKVASDPEMVAAPFDLPKSWAWVSIGTAFLYDAGIKREPRALDQSLWLLELEDIEKATGRLVSRVRSAERASKSTKSEFQPGDILYGKLRPYLNKVLVADELGYSTTEIVAIRPYVPLCSEYCALALRRPDFVEYVTTLGQGTKMPRLRTKDAIVAPFPLPPLAEQHRIVAKVDEFMALCDRLEINLGNVDAGRERILEFLARNTFVAEEPKTHTDEFILAITDQ